MITKLIGAIACLVLLVGLGAMGILNSGTQQKDEVKWIDKYSLKEIARRSKGEGKLTVTIPGPRIDYPGMDMTLEETLRDHGVVVAEVIVSKSYPFNSRGVRTWYKFRIVDPLSEKYAAYCNTCPEVPEAPEDLLPINSDELLLPASGGTVNVEGVALTMTGDLSFDSGKKYLLFVSLAQSRVALAIPSGVFGVDENERLEAVYKAGPMQAEISQRFDGNLSKLKSYIKR